MARFSASLRSGEGGWVGIDLEVLMRVWLVWDYQFMPAQARLIPACAGENFVSSPFALWVFGRGVGRVLFGKPHSLSLWRRSGVRGLKASQR